MAKTKKTEILKATLFPMSFILLLWFVHVLRFSTGWPSGRLGLFPRDFSGLKGIITAPLIHGDWNHLVSNTLPLLALGLLIFVFYKKVALKSFALIYLLTGIAVWLFGRNVFHIGASGVVYGLVSFVFWSGIFRRNVKSIVLALIILIMYSGYFLGVVPGQEGISWESHLLGAFAGILVAYIFKNEIEQDEVPIVYQLEESNEPFFERDAFEKTREQKEKEKRNESWVSDQS